MSPDTIPQFSLGTAALVIFAVCAAFVLLRGITRMLAATLVLGTSAWIGFQVWQHAPALSIRWFGSPVAGVVTGMPIAAFIASFLAIRKLGKTIARPFGGNDGQPASRPGSRLAMRLLLALIPTGLIWLIGATVVHHAGSVAEIENFANQARGTPASTATGFSEKLKGSIESALPDSWICFLDPLTDPERLSLAKMIAKPDPEPVIDPRTGEVIPRAIIIDDPELESLVREGKFATLLRHPLLTKALTDPKIRELLRNLNLQS